nr:MAG TPA: hypothetical protein [Caudoviricetes sp.]
MPRRLILSLGMSLLSTRTTASRVFFSRRLTRRLGVVLRRLSEMSLWLLRTA